MGLETDVSMSSRGWGEDTSEISDEKSRPERLDELSSETTDSGETNAERNESVALESADAGASGEVTVEHQDVQNEAERAETSRKIRCDKIVGVWKANTTSSSPATIGRVGGYRSDENARNRAQTPQNTSEHERKRLEQMMEENAPGRAKYKLDEPDAAAQDNHHNHPECSRGERNDDNITATRRARRIEEPGQKTK
ncbi:hypothetical protein OG21DRAFT_1520609 [Imleria badia]|nr:hypothetical protein OG21DRAFT_1520609 [Imleria badia]